MFNGFVVLKRGAVALTAAVLAAGCATPLVNTVPAPAPAVQSTAQPAPAGAAVAARPADASVRIVSPANGAVVNAGSVKVTINYSGPTLVPGAQAAKLTDYHLHYLLDADVRPYLGSGLPIPAGRPDIIHTAASEVTFDNVSPGSHTVAIVLGGSNHVSVDPAVVDEVSFTAH